MPAKQDSGSATRMCSPSGRKGRANSRSLSFPGAGLTAVLFHLSCVEFPWLHAPEPHCPLWEQQWPDQSVILCCHSGPVLPLQAHVLLGISTWLSSPLSPLAALPWPRPNNFLLTANLGLSPSFQIQIVRNLNMGLDTRNSPNHAMSGGTLRTLRSKDISRAQKPSMEENQQPQH